MRGMAGLDAAIISGMAHMTSFCGSETIPAIEAVEHYYNADVTKELVAATVPATEHSVMCAGGDWDGVVYPMLQELFANDSTITLYIYKLCNN